MPNDLSELLLSLCIQWTFFKDLLWIEHFNRHLDQTLNILERVSQISHVICSVQETQRAHRDSFYHLSKVGTFVLGLEKYSVVPQAERKSDNKGMKAFNRHVWGSSSSLLSEEHWVWVWAWQESVLREVGRGQNSHSTDLSWACVLGSDRKSGKRWK